ncbi:MAG: NAD-dependent epimerase/dehydratase family protein [Saprospiraceae bacterium]|nr:MAG: NAD-dependent epimerase/dehydratase [Bacteroidetes bacterium OLB9]MCO6463450.1 NAD-dependent epimerase/dehydratase family protein [Saprospiraceae bacterium]MCZ2338810.1 NAD-dependent epimerase/dehydratase family protein [Chitinophagales bacterium]
MRVAVTGATGHIGSAVCRALIQRQYSVVALVRNESDVLRGLPIQQIYGDITIPESIDKLTAQCDAIIHTAGLIRLGYTFDQEIYDINFEGTKNILKSAHKNNVKRIVHFSSIEVFDLQQHQEVINETSSFVSDNALFYARSKRDAHILAQKEAKSGMDIVIVCPTSVVGAPDYKPSKIGRAIQDLYRGKFPAVMKGGFNFVDLEDVALGAVLALERGRAGETYILGGTFHSIKMLADLVLKARGSRRKMLELPIFTAMIGLPFIRAYAYLTQTEPIYDKEYLDVLKSGNKKISSEKAIRELSFSARPLSETIENTIRWFKDTGAL